MEIYVTLNCSIYVFIIIRYNLSNILSYLNHEPQWNNINSITLVSHTQWPLLIFCAIWLILNYQNIFANINCMPMPNVVFVFQDARIKVLSKRTMASTEHGVGKLGWVELITTVANSPSLQDFRRGPLFICGHFLPFTSFYSGELCPLLFFQK